MSRSPFRDHPASFQKKRGDARGVSRLDVAEHRQLVATAADQSKRCRARHHVVPQPDGCGPEDPNVLCQAQEIGNGFDSEANTAGAVLTRYEDREHAHRLTADQILLFISDVGYQARSDS